MAQPSTAGASRTARPISLAAGVMPDFGPVETSQAAVAAGFDMAGVWVDLASWTPATTVGVRQALGGLPVLDVEYIRLAPGPLDEAGLRLIDIGAELGAANVLIVSGDPDDQATADKLARLAAYGAERGVRANLEFGVFTAVKSLAQALAILEASGDPSLAVLLDPIHVDRAGVAVREVAAIPRSRLSYAQFCDAPAERPAASDLPAVLRDALDLRMMPGEGALPLQAFLQGLPADLPLSIELRSEALRTGAPDVFDRARRLAAASRAWLAEYDRPAREPARA